LDIDSKATADINLLEEAKNLVEKKRLLYDQGFRYGCFMSWFFGLLAGICIYQLETKSGKLGYMKGLGVMAIITGSVLFLCFNYSKCGQLCGWCQ
jgi:hypothetical protein